MHIVQRREEDVALSPTPIMSPEETSEESSSYVFPREKTPCLVVPGELQEDETPRSSHSRRPTTAKRPCSEEKKAKRAAHELTTARDSVASIIGQTTTLTVEAVSKGEKTHFPEKLAIVFHLPLGNAIVASGLTTTAERLLSLALRALEWASHLDDGKGREDLSLEATLRATRDTGPLDARRALAAVRSAELAEKCLLRQKHKKTTPPPKIKLKRLKNKPPKKPTTKKNDIRMAKQKAIQAATAANAMANRQNVDLLPGAKTRFSIPDLALFLRFIHALAATPQQNQENIEIHLAVSQLVAKALLPTTTTTTENNK